MISFNLYDDKFLGNTEFSNCHMLGDVVTIGKK